MYRCEIIQGVLAQQETISLQFHVSIMPEPAHRPGGRGSKPENVQFRGRFETKPCVKAA